MTLSISFMFILLAASTLLNPLARLVSAGSVTKSGSVCTVHPSPSNSTSPDDAPAIISAFEQCSSDATVVFENATYHIEQIMNTTGLQNVTIDHRGTLLWGTNLTYWRNNSLPLGYQNQTTAWFFGGSNITWDGHGYGTFDGNGQLWYDLANGTSNLAGRPISLVIAGTTKSLFTGIRFVQSQFWTMAITRSEDVLLEHIYVNSTSSSNAPTQNTDGCDTFYSNRITFRDWSVDCGDDNISTKANSSNILIQDSVFHRGDGVAIGTIGQYLDTYEFIENVTAERIVATGTEFVGYVKTWTGIQQNYPPNGGGGGIGYVKNIVFRDFTVNNILSSIAQITQCISYSGATGGCDTSHFQLSNITWGPITGTVASGSLAQFQCSGDAPCPGIQLVGFDEIQTNGTRDISCSHVVDPVGFNCTEGD
ncbi:glycoside hydrolase family 28 protein [Plicaturopsis crispa FD-325 SS-3]|nr:glycoside hydrolase family 28 protein [Plicaturopsis crispa FD-325 SS-3]